MDQDISVRESEEA